MIHARRRESGISRSRENRREPTGCIEFPAAASSSSTATFWPPFSLSIFRFFVSFAILLRFFHAWQATENRELSALLRPYALSLLSPDEAKFFQFDVVFLRLNVEEEELDSTRNF